MIFDSAAKPRNDCRSYPACRKEHDEAHLRNSTDRALSKVIRPFKLSSVTLLFGFPPVWYTGSGDYCKLETLEYR